MYLINIMFGNPRQIRRFRFTPIANEGPEEFDKAVKSLNEIYHENGRFSTKEEVILHFKSFGFTRISV